MLNSSAPLAREGAQPDAREAQSPLGRDADWALAMGYALGLGSGFKVPIVPTVEAFQHLFSEVRKRAALAASPASVPAGEAETAEQHFKFTDDELRAMRRDPRVLSALMDYHEAQQTEAESIMGAEDATTGNKLRKQALYERGRSIMTEDIDTWDNDLRRVFGFPEYAPPVAAAMPGVELLTTMAERADLTTDALQLLPRKLLDVACRLGVRESRHGDDKLIDQASHALSAALSQAAAPKQAPGAAG